MPKIARLIPFLFILSLAGCAPSLLASPPVDFSRFHDRPLAGDVTPWLQSGEQSAISSRVVSIAQKIRGENRRERLYHAAVLVGKSLPLDRWYNDSSFSLTADELLERGKLGGCSDFALVQIALFRALAIPARMVVTANLDWIHRFRRDRLSMSEGHCFVEVFLEDQWFLFDSTFRWLYAKYDPARDSYPHGEVFCMRGRDFWDMGIRSNGDFDDLLRKTALGFRGSHEEPNYPKEPF